jgi:uncharacterized protein DUF4136
VRSRSTLKFDVRTLKLAGIALLLSSAALVADDRTVLFDRSVDFAAFKTFTVHDAPVSSKRPELNSPITIKNVTDAIRAGLVAKGLKETADPADLTVEYGITSTDFDVSPWGVIRPIDGGRGRRGGGAEAPPNPDFTDATLVVDLKAGQPSALIWRGVYNHTQKNAMELTLAFPLTVGKLLSDYPPKKK